ncbi:wax ester/triacylglycerol synthase family O-acyltransferase [Mycobacterium sp. CPCC 205710]|uniref:Diacylglycerol O-acyltransferase n=1 Tax=Mycobacterium deserti TaxID=2978347 RepID=A0ABT2MAG2_9MYCO|nr:wax ester/triacylglycerol synthase family O-acyltransferase [Mycobacterium deserti]
MNRLTGFDTSLLTLEAPTQPMTGCGLFDLDTTTMPGGYSFENFRDTLRARVAALPEFRMKLADNVFNLDMPVWVDDPDFDLDQHLHHVTLPAPGGRRELSELVGRLVAGRLDRSRSLWDMWVIEGVSTTDSRFSGSVAVLLRMHHVMADGATALDIFSRLCSTQADAPAPAARDGVGTTTRREIALDGLVRLASRPWVLMSKVLPATVAGVIRARRRATTSALFTAPRTLFNGDVTERRNVAYVQLDLQDVRAVKDSFGVTVNDVTAALAAGALRQYLLNRRALPAFPLVAAMPISVFDANRSGRNQLSSMDSSLCTDIADPAQRLKSISAASAAAKSRISTIGPTLLQDWMQCAPGLLALMARLYRLSGQATRRPRYNLTFSNVRGPEEQTYLLGSAVRARYAFGPIFHGSGLMIIVMSQGGNLDIGLVACPDLLPDLWEVADEIPGALEELLDASTQSADISAS